MVEGGDRGFQLFGAIVLDVLDAFHLGLSLVLQVKFIVSVDAFRAQRFQALQGRTVICNRLIHVLFALVVLEILRVGVAGRLARVLIIETLFVLIIVCWLRGDAVPLVDSGLLVHAFLV